MDPGPPVGAPSESRLSPVPQGVRRLLALLAVILIAVGIFLFQDRLRDAGSAAYPAIFLLALASNATLIIPVPGFLAVCAAATTLSPFLVGLLAGAGWTLGETTGYLAGYSGRGILERNRLYRRIQPWMNRRGWIVLFLFAVTPNPAFDLAGIAAGAARIPLWQFYSSVGAGKTIRAVGLAYACSHGYDLFFIHSGFTA